MATPATGAISFNDLNVEILQQSGTTSVSLNDAGVRLGYGSTAQVSMSDLRKTYGATITCGTYTDKFVSADGYSSALGGGFGTVDDIYITGTMTLNDALDSDDVGSYCGFGSVATGFEGTGVNRVATAGINRSITGSGTDYVNFTYDFPTSGTVTLGIRWNV